MTDSSRTTRLKCPPEEALAPLARGESTPPEVQQHVELCPRCRSRVAALLEAAPRSTRTEGAGRAETGSAPPPERIGKYTVVGCLGSGGQADVYRAVHPALQKSVVLKLGRRAISLDAGSLERFQTEARLLAQLDHPNLARVYDLDLHEGRPYIVLEYVEGRSLAEYARSQPPSPGGAAELLAQVARALAAAHRKGAVHRDIKPQNVLVGEDGRPRLIDFGIALLRNPWTDQPVQEGEVSGTIEFMAPEQARGEIDRIGPASDIFALGSVLYFLLVGRGPFAAPTIREAIEKAQRCELDRGALRHAPRALRKICFKALAPEPADRFRTADDLASALEGFRREPRRRAILAATVLVLLGSAGVALYRLGTFRVEEASLWLALPGGPRQLLDGDAIREKDRLSLHFRASKPCYLYVLNEDEGGRRQRLYPSSKLGQRNPLPAGVRHKVPEDPDRPDAAWVVTTRGGRESLFMVASLEPIAELEIEASEVTSVAVRQVLRGIEVVTEPRAEDIAAGRSLLADVVEELGRSHESGATKDGVWIRRITLSNP